MRDRALGTTGLCSSLISAHSINSFTGLLSILSSAGSVPSSSPSACECIVRMPGIAVQRNHLVWIASTLSTFQLRPVATPAKYEKKPPDFVGAKQQQAKIMAQKACSQVHQAQQPGKLARAHTHGQHGRALLAISLFVFPLHVEHGIAAPQRHARHLKKICIPSPELFRFHFRAIHQLSVSSHARSDQKITLLRAMFLPANTPVRDETRAADTSAAFLPLPPDQKAIPDLTPADCRCPAAPVPAPRLARRPHDAVQRLIGGAIASAGQHSVKASFRSFLHLLDCASDVRSSASLNLHARHPQNFLHARDVLRALLAPAS